MSTISEAAAADRPTRPVRGKRSRAKTVGFVLVAAVLLGAILALLGELALRLYVFARGWTANCYAAQLELFEPDPDLGYHLRPNFRLKSGVYDISTNALGLRGPEVALPKPPGVTRVALLGESAAFGYLVSDGEEAARLFVSLANQKGRAIEVVNAGVPGYNLYQIVPRFERIVRPLEPEIVILYAGWNDLVYITSDEPANLEYRVRPVAPFWERTLGRSTLYGFLAYRILGGDTRLAPADITKTQPTAAGKAAFLANLERLREAVAASGAALVVCSQASAAHPAVAPGLMRSLHKNPDFFGRMIELGRWLDQTLEEFARHNGLEFIDVYDAIPPTEKYLGDYIHLTQAGEVKLAEIFAQWFVNRDKRSKVE